MPWRLHQGDEIGRRVARERRAAEVRIGTDEVLVRVPAGRCSRLVKLARPPPEMRTFSATFSLWSSTSTLQAALTGEARRRKGPLRPRR